MILSSFVAGNIRKGKDQSQAAEKNVGRTTVRPNRSDCNSRAIKLGKGKPTEEFSVGCAKVGQNSYRNRLA